MYTFSNSADKKRSRYHTLFLMVTTERILVASSLVTPMKGYKITVVKKALNKYWQKIDR